MDKTARTKAKDPIQESLREEKSQWNSEVSEWISELIELKKAINGKSSNLIGNSSSSLKDPLPSEINSFINHVSSKNSDVLGKANNIIRHQKEYSDSKQKAKQAFLQDLGLVSEASWAGSRLMSHFSLLALDKSERKLRFNLIKSALDLYRQHEELENDLLGSADDHISHSFTALSRILNTYQGTILNYFNQILEAEKNSISKNQKKKNKEEEIKQKEEVKKEEIFEPSLTFPSVNQTETSPEMSEKLKAMSEKLHAINSNKEGIRAGLGILASKETNASEEIKKNAKTLSQMFSKQISNLIDLSNKTPNKEEMIPTLETFFNLCDKILELLDNNKQFFVGKENIVEDALSKSLRKKAGYADRAYNAGNRWVKELFLGFKDEGLPLMILGAVNLSKRCRNLLDKLLNLLENKDTSTEELTNYIKLINKTYSALISQMLLLGKDFVFLTRGRSKDKNLNLKEIKEQDISLLVQQARFFESLN